MTDTAETDETDSKPKKDEPKYDTHELVKTAVVALTSAIAGFITKKYVSQAFDNYASRNDKSAENDDKTTEDTDE